MNPDYYKDIPAGKSIPLNNPYAFSVSMPEIEDVINYAEGTEKSKNTIKQAYPRILTHPYIKRILEIASEELKLDGFNLLLLPNRVVAEKVKRLSSTSPEFYSFNKYTIAAFSKHDTSEIENYYAFMKHCGFMIYAREAEDFLLSIAENVEPFSEDVDCVDPEVKILKVLSEGYKSSRIVLSNCGMNSIYTGFEAVKDFGKRQGRNLFILYGWAYSDTIQIFKKCTDEFINIPDVSSTQELEDTLNNRGHEVAALYMETVSNPLIEVPDFPKVHSLTKKYNIPLLVDNTFATPWNVDINPYCDMIFESLTKFASGHGDVMAGALIIPDKSMLNSSLIESIRENSIPLYKREMYRLARTIKDYKSRVEKISENTKIFIDYLKNNRAIKDIYSVFGKKQLSNWEKISINSDSVCGVVSLVFNKSLEEVYDIMELPKGPSLGTEFPIVMAYTLLAHYKETQTKAGLDYLKSIGLSPNLLRISIGVDDSELLIEKINKSTKF